MWANGHKFRILVLHKSAGWNTLQFVTGTSTNDRTVAEQAKSYGAAEICRVLACGYGREYWRYDLSNNTAKEQIQQWRKKIQKLGFIQLYSGAP